MIKILLVHSENMLRQISWAATVYLINGKVINGHPSASAVPPSMCNSVPMYQVEVKTSESQK